MVLWLSFVGCVWRSIKCSFCPVTLQLHQALLWFHRDLAGQRRSWLVLFGFLFWKWISRVRRCLSFKKMLYRIILEAWAIHYEHYNSIEKEFKFIRLINLSQDRPFLILNIMAATLPRSISFWIFYLINILINILVSLNTSRLNSLNPYAKKMVFLFLFSIYYITGKTLFKDIHTLLSTALPVLTMYIIDLLLANVRVIGLTGGIACGKSTLVNYLK